MGLSKNIKMVMLDKNIKISELANRLNIDAKVLSVKLSRDNLSGKSIIDIANALECDVKFVDRAGGKVY
nr:MAG TPA: SOS-response transcriptional repressor [Caudoviricetes sp.]